MMIPYCFIGSWKTADMSALEEPSSLENEEYIPLSVELVHINPTAYHTPDLPNANPTPNSSQAYPNMEGGYFSRIFTKQVAKMVTP
jgi:hypothetical protein